MKRAVRWQTGIGCAVIFGLIVSPSRLAQAGWSGLMNGLGQGTTSVNAKSSTLILSVTNTPGKVTNSPTTVLISATIPPASTYVNNAPLPSGSSLRTIAQSKLL